MSDLQKFENSERWREKLRNFLLKESQPNTLQPKGFQFTETNRYSLDISEDLKNLIEEKKKKKMAERNAAKYQDAAENKENQTKYKKTNYIKKEMLDDTMIGPENCEKGAKNQDISDESFEAMELMCNKTASDPNSTLFQYLHSDKKQDVVAEIKRRLSGYEPPQSVEEEEADHNAIDKLLNKLRMEDQKEINDESPLKGTEMTQIEDIEAPSRFWDNDTILQTSPVKMVGLLRPSTIYECAEVSDVSSAQASFTTARRDPLSEISSSCYETASDTTSFDKRYDHEYKPDLYTSVNLIDLEKTIKEEPEEFKIHKNKSPIKMDKLIDLTIDADIKDSAEDSEESVIELLSDDEQLEAQHSVPLIKFEDDSINDANECTVESTCDKNVLHTSSASLEQSLHFNDTLEEVEYMMQKGLEFMAGAGITPKESPFKLKTLPSPKMQAQKQLKFPKSPVKDEYLLSKKEKVVTPHGTPASQENSAQKSATKCESRFAINFKPKPKIEFFKKPLSTNKSASKTGARPKDKFAHVVSPIGTYIKKTAEVPLLSAIRTDGDEKNSSVFRELDFESRMHKQNFGNPKAELPKSPNPRSLPKKAYISSEYRQFVDERSAITIPGNKDLKKYLDAAVLPSVIQHDGKANLASSSVEASNLLRLGEASSHLPKRVEIKNDSFADLSLMTGDVSLYTIKDAQKL